MLTANDVTLDTLAGDWRIFQLRTGHRFSADDLLTAWAAVRAKPEALRLLDLGSGLGSVGLLVLWKLPTTGHLTMVEVQAVSHALACHTVAYNDLTGRVTLHHQDLRGVPGRGGDRGGTAFKRGDAFFQHRGGRISDPGIDVAEGLQPEQGGGVFGVVEHE